MGRNVSVLIAIGVGTDGHRRVLGVVEGAKEDKAGWVRGVCGGDAYVLRVSVVALAEDPD